MLYEYECKKCGLKLEIEQKISDKPKKKCPKCKKISLLRLISNTTFVLQGGGWYRDGYR